jgi:hypothetical protein
MSLITRTAKGSKLTIAEMDGNLEFLASSSFQDGVYSQTVIGIGDIIGTIGDTIEFSNPLDSGTAGTYIVSPTTDGSGTGAQFELVVFESRGAFAIDGSLSAVLNGGSGYAVGDTLTVDLMDLGGNDGETVEFGLLDGGVNETKTSTITVTEDEINLSSTTLTVTGAVEFFEGISVAGNLTTTKNISANQGNFTNQVTCNQLSVANLSSDTVINFANLKTFDPVVLGQLWNDSGSLKISAGA